jgi:hydroxymethylglutaryl-CoA reductase
MCRTLPFGASAMGMQVIARFVEDIVPNLQNATSPRLAISTKSNKFSECVHKVSAIQDIGLPSMSA